MAESPKEINPQTTSPLFSRIPPEVRNYIFKLVLTAYEDPQLRYSRFAPYYRPGYTCAHRIDTALLLTCRLIYAETTRLPASINERTFWFYRSPPRTPENDFLPNNGPATWLRRQELSKVHIFVQQYWLEHERHGFFAFADHLWEHANPTHLTITLRHTDWWWWEVEAPLALDPKQSGRPSPEKHSQPSDPFEPGSWGSTFQKVKGLQVLQVLQIELETVEGKKGELDAIVNRAKGWKIPLGDEKILILDESRTRRTGWIGGKFGKSITEIELHDQLILPDEELGVLDQGVDGFDSDEDILDEDHIEGSHSPENLALTPDHPTNVDSNDHSTSSGSHSCNAPPSAKERLEAAGVKFNDADSVKGLPENKTSTYYVVTLTWRAHRL
ncbi:MAG: hypothetical protein Q9225_004308 [Loekoesia sp. 1 TL-2023]